MSWETSSSPVGCADDVTCDYAGCTSSARFRFVSINRDLGGVRRWAARCDVHAVELHAKIKPVPASTMPAEQPLGQPPEAPSRPPRLFPVPDGSKPVPCRSCGETVFWVLTVNMKRMPVDAFGPTKGQSHFSTCPNADAHRKARA